MGLLHKRTCYVPDINPSSGHKIDQCSTVVLPRLSDLSQSELRTRSLCQRVNQGVLLLSSSIR